MQLNTDISTHGVSITVKRLLWQCISLSIIISELGVVFGYATSGTRLNNEKKLIDKLQKTYPQKFGRPLVNLTGPVVISLRSQLIQIVKVDPNSQVLVTNVWNNFNWKDPYLSWDPKDYNDLKTIRLPASFAFEIDIKLMNNADERLEYKREALLVIYSSGDIQWIPRSIFSSTCHIDLKYFPFDRQNCSISFGSWSFDNTLIDLEFYDNESKIDLSDYESSKEWQIQNNVLFGTKTNRVEDNKNYTVLTYYLIMNRNPGFYLYLLIMPCVLLAILTMVVFWLPPETPSKIILGMNIFTAFFLLLLLLAELVPTSTNEVPYIGIYFCLNMVMIALSSFLCTIVVHVYFRADTFCRMPPILKKIFLEWLARIYFMQPSKSNQSVTERTLLNSGLMHGGKNVQNADKFEKFELLKERFKSYRENVLKIGFDNLLKTHPAIASSCTNMNNSNMNIFLSENSSPTSSLNNNPQNNLHKQTCCCSYCAYCTQQQTILTEIAYLNNLEHDIKEIRNYLRDTRKKLENKELKVKLAADWKQTALVLDRTFFFIYLFITVVTIMIMNPSNIDLSKPTPHSILSTVSNTVSTATAATLKSYQERNSSGFLFF